MSFECLKCDGRRRRLVADWESWLKEADRLYAQHLREHGSPFEYHEVAAVGFLTSAAARAGFLTLNEYEIVKQRWTGKPGRPPHYSGRADLWMLKKGVSYSFEFKRAWYRATQRNLERTLATVRKDIHAVPWDECHYAAGGVIAYVKHSDCLPKYFQFSESEDVDLAYHIGPAREGGAFIYFSIKD